MAEEALIKEEEVVRAIKEEDKEEAIITTTKEASDNVEWAIAVGLMLRLT